MRDRNYLDEIPQARTQRSWMYVSEQMNPDCSTKSRKSAADGPAMAPCSANAIAAYCREEATPTILVDSAFEGVRQRVPKTLVETRR
jgi:hypothetical protein